LILSLSLAAFQAAWPAPNDSSTLSSAYDQGLDKQEIFEQANRFYREGELEKSLEGYLYLANLGIKNGRLFYNLGNTQFALGEIGPAMLWYERALKYLPRFEDLRVNYEYAQGALTDEEFRRPEYGGTTGFLLRLHRLLNLRESLVLTLVLFWLTAAALILRASIGRGFLERWLRIPCWIVGIAFIIICLSSAFKIDRQERIAEAIVMSPAVEVKTGPGKDFSTSFSLHEGLKVVLIQEQGGWKRIVLPGNTTFTGWLPAQSVEAI